MDEKPKRGPGFAGNPERASAAGKKGSAVVRERYGDAYYSELGVKGGEANRQKGREHFRELGKLGAQKRWEAERQRRLEGRG
jgi:general stress protein YciG